MSGRVQTFDLSCMYVFEALSCCIAEFSLALASSQIMGRPGACDGIRSVEEIPPEGERRESHAAEGGGEEKEEEGCGKKKKKKKKKPRAAAFREIRVNSEIKVCQADLTSRFVSNSDQNAPAEVFRLFSSCAPFF